MYKKNILLTIFISLLFFILSSCTSSTSSGINATESLADGKFEGIQFINGVQHNIIFNTEIIKSTDKLTVYLQEGHTLDSEYLNYIVDNFEESYSNLIETYGTHTDVDGNGKISIVFFDINNGEQEGSYIAGYFNPADLMMGFGNNAEILYIDSVNTSEVEDIIATVHHEFQHLINFNMNFVEKSISSDLWINESLSESADILSRNGELPSHRLNEYNNNFSVNVSKGDYFYKWDGTLADTSTASIFMYWLYIQSGSKSDIFRDIAYSSSSFNYISVLNAVNNNKGIPLLKSATWSDILLSWLEANYKNDKLGLYGYEDKVIVAPKLFSGGNVALYPGGAIYSMTEPSSNNDNIVTKMIKDDGDNIFISINKSVDLNSPPINVSTPSLPNLRKSKEFNLTDTQVSKSEYRIRHISQGELLN